MKAERGRTRRCRVASDLPSPPMSAPHVSSAPPGRHDDDLLDSAAVAEELGVSPLTLKDWRRRRIGPPYARLGGSRVVRYRRDDLRAWVEARREVGA